MLSIELGAGWPEAETVAKVVVVGSTIRNGDDEVPSGLCELAEAVDVPLLERCATLEEVGRVAEFVS